MKKWIAQTVLASIVLMASGVANAGLVNMTWGGNWNSPPTMTGAAVIGSAGDQWNQLNAPAWNNPAAPTTVFSNMVDSNGNATGYDLYAANNNGWAQRTVSSSVWTGTGYEGLMNGYSFNTTTNYYTWTVQNLPANSVWDVYLYMQGDTAATGRRATFSINGTEQTSAAAAAADNTFILNKNYLVFSGVQADGSGNLDILWKKNTGEANWNGMQMQGGAVVPEASTLALFSLGFLGLIGYRWRSRKKAG